MASEWMWKGQHRQLECDEAPFLAFLFDRSFPFSDSLRYQPRILFYRNEILLMAHEPDFMERKKKTWPQALRLERA
jgi:hypothetical protein